MNTGLNQERLSPDSIQYMAISEKVTGSVVQIKLSKLVDLLDQTVGFMLITH